MTQQNLSFTIDQSDSEAYTNVRMRVLMPGSKSRPSPKARIKHKEGERFTMLRGVVVVALSLVCCSAVSADGEWTEQQVQQSKQWNDARSPLILIKSGRL